MFQCNKFGNSLKFVILKYGRSFAFCAECFHQSVFHFYIKLILQCPFPNLIAIFYTLSFVLLFSSYNTFNVKVYFLFLFLFLFFSSLSCLHVSCQVASKVGVTNVSIKKKKKKKRKKKERKKERKKLCQY